ncbi:MAG: hypothetical protein ACUZ8I_17275 [Candidatus Scalindua sp.]
MGDNVLKSVATTSQKKAIEIMEISLGDLRNYGRTNISPRGESVEIMNPGILYGKFDFYGSYVRDNDSEKNETYTYDIVRKKLEKYNRKKYENTRT